MKEFWKKALVYLGLAYEEEETPQDFEDQDFLEDFEESKPAVRRIQRSPDVSRAKRAVLRPVTTAPQTRVHIVEPRNFNDAKQIADKFKANIPVILNLQQNDAELCRRLIDFTSGLSYGLNGGMQRIAKKVFLLTPSNVEVSAEEKRRLREKGFFNQFQEEVY
ncbi:MAG: cell division protein SepF [Terriglobia bacterium]